MRNFIKYHYNNVQKLLFLLEEYYNLVGSVSRMSCYREKVSTNLFDITLKIDDALLFSGGDILKYKISLNMNNEEYLDMYYDDRINFNKVQSFINKNSYDILDRVYIDVTKLSKPFCEIYKNYVSRQKNKSTQLTKINKRSIK